jgi:hypothetical protein
MTQGRFYAFDLSRASARHRGAATLAALAFAFALAVAGCGGGGKSGSGGGTQLSKNQYEALIQKDGQELTTVFKPLNTPPTSLKQFAESIKKGEDKLRAVADDLDGIKPPAEISKDNDQLVAGLRSFADRLEPVRKGAADNDANALKKAVGDIQGSSPLKAAQQATLDMKKKGYDIGELGR